MGVAKRGQAECGKPWQRGSRSGKPRQRGKPKRGWRPINHVLRRGKPWQAVARGVATASALV